MLQDSFKWHDLALIMFEFAHLLFFIQWKYYSGMENNIKKKIESLCFIRYCIDPIHLFTDANIEEVILGHSARDSTTLIIFLIYYWHLDLV